MFPSVSVDAMRSYCATPLESVGIAVLAVETMLVPNAPLSIVNTLALGVLKNVKSPSPVLVSPLPCTGTAWITACCVGPSESAPLEYQSTRQCFWM